MSKGKHSRRTRVVAIGGGTGLSTMLRGLKRQNIDITAIVTVADNGGGSGVLRQELGMLPPGDVRNCIQALANTEPTLEALLGYRFTEGSLKGQSFGNLFPPPSTECAAPLRRRWPGWARCWPSPGGYCP